MVQLLWISLRRSTIHRPYWYRQEEVTPSLSWWRILSLGESLDWPAIDINSQEDWEALVTKLQASQNHLLDQLEDLSEDIDLDGLVPGKTAEDYTIRYMLYGLVQHDTYHLGQIALTWKLIR